MNQRTRKQYQKLPTLLLLIMLPAVTANCSSIRVNVEPNGDRNSFTLQDNLAETGEREAIFTSKQDAQLLGKVTIRHNLTSDTPQEFHIQVRKGQGYYAAEAPVYETEKTRLSLSLTKQKEYGMIAGFRISYRW